MASFTPTIGSKGLWRIGSPYDTLLLPNIEYTCTGLQSITDLVTKGIDVLATYYTPVGLTQTQLDADIAAGTLMVSLQSDVGNLALFPSNYLLGMPDINGVPYYGYIVALDVAMLPANFDFSYLNQRLSEVTLATIGVTPAVSEVITTLPTLFTQDQSAAITSTRTTNIADVNTDYSNLLAANAEIATLRQQITILSDYIAAQQKAAATPTAPTTPST